MIGQQKGESLLAMEELKSTVVSILSSFCQQKNNRKKAGKRLLYIHGISMSWLLDLIEKMLLHEGWLVRLPVKFWMTRSKATDLIHHSILNSIVRTFLVTMLRVVRNLIVVNSEKLVQYPSGNSVNSVFFRRFENFDQYNLLKAYTAQLYLTLGRVELHLNFLSLHRNTPMFTDFQQCT